MNSGYDQPLYVPPFDHRHSYLKKVFHAQPQADGTARTMTTVSRDGIAV